VRGQQVSQIRWYSSGAEVARTTGILARSVSFRITSRSSIPLIPIICISERTASGGAERALSCPEYLQARLVEPDESKHLPTWKPGPVVGAPGGRSSSSPA
jgi:hypothetical protein